MPEPVSIYDRPAIAMQLLLSGRLKQAGKAIVNPDDLSPEDRQTLAEKHGLTGFTKLITQVASNPLVILALVMHLKYPVASAKAIMKFRDTAINLTKRAGPMLRGVASLHTNFANTGTKAVPGGIPGVVDEIGFLGGEFRQAHSKGVIDAVLNYEKQQGHPIGQKAMSRITMWMKGMYKADNKFNSEIWKMDTPLWKGRLGVGEQKVAEALRDAYKGVGKEIWGREDVHQVLIKLLEKKGPGNVKLPETIKALKGRLGEVGVKVSKWQKGDTAQSVAKELVEKGVLKADDLASATDQRSLVRALRAQGWAATGGKSLAGIKKYEDYAPEMVRFSAPEMEEATKAFINATGGEAAAGNVAAAQAKTVMSRFFKKKNWRMIPDPVELEMMGPGEIDIGALRQLESQVAKSFGREAASTAASFKDLTRSLADMTSPALSATLKGGDVVRRYSTLSLPVFGEYMKTASHQFAWTVKGKGKELMSVVDKLDDLGKHMMRDTYIPMLMGKGTYRQSIQSMEWAASRDKTLRTLLDPKGWMVKNVPQGTRKWLYDHVLNTRGALTMQGASSGLANYFYVSAMGFNVSSSIKNLLQTTLTTLPLIGKHTTTGLKAVGIRGKKYLGYRFKDGMPMDAAIRKAFPEFVKAGMEPAPITERLMKSGLDDSWASASKVLSLGGSPSRNTWSKLQGHALSMFQSSEIFNRLTAFYGGMGKGLAEGMKSAEAMKLGAAVTRFTQFPAGPGQTPYMMSNVPGILKQFSHFPLRYAEFLRGSTLMPWGEGAMAAKKGLFGTGFNPGTVARGVGLSAAAYETGKEVLDIDLSNALLWGALPMPMSEDAPFYPFPIVPPVVSIPAAVIKGVHTGDWKQLKYASGLMLPGGIALQRLRRAVSPEFADYKNRNENGDVPLHSGTGTLIGHFPPMHLWGRALWSSSLNASQERGMMKYMIQQRDNIRAFRRSYVEAIASNDMAQANDIQAQWKDTYPKFGELQVKKQDLEAVRMRKEFVRLERMLDTMPKEYRAQYGRMISQAMEGVAVKLVGVDPDLLYAPNMAAKKRRQVMMQRAGRGRRGGGRGYSPQMPSGPQMPASTLNPPVGSSGASFGNFGKY